MRCFAGTDVGRFRKTNQDFPFASAEAVGPLPNLFMVADGMGGHKAGDYASRFIVEQVNKNLKALPEGTKPVAALKRAIEQANADLYSESLKDPGKEGMGSTLVAVTMADQAMYIANVGDSRLYLLRDDLSQVTRDHSLVEEMVAQGKMERDSEFYRLQKNIITRAMGISPQVRIDFFEVPLMEGDCVLLCSDGLTNMVDDAGISRILKTTDTLEEKTEALIHAANENGGKDNIAVVLVEPQISEVRL